MDSLNSQIKETKKTINLESIPVFVLYLLVFLLPIFSLPIAVEPFAFSKTLLFFVGTSIALLFWLLIILRKGNILIPKSNILFSMVGIIIAWIIATIFSSNFKLSFFGAGYEVGTTAFFIFSGILLLLVSSFFQTEKRIFLFYLSIFLSSLFVFIFQLFHTVFNITLIPWKDFFPNTISNLIGSWNDFSIFFGFIALSALVFFELYKFNKNLRKIFFAIIVLSVIAMAAVNFSIAWLIFGFSVLVLLIFLFFESIYLNNKSAKYFNPSAIMRFSLFVLLAVVFFSLMPNFLGNMTDSMNTSTVMVRPSWSATWEVVTASVKESPVWGSGPNTFLYDWLKFKPAVINSTIFWSTRFQSGVGSLPSMVAGTGILGILSLIAFLFFLFYSGAKIISYTGNDLIKAFLISSYLGSIYLWLFTIFYSPGVTIFTLAFLATGVLIATLIKANKINMIDISFTQKPNIGFVSVLVIILLIILSIVSGYFFFQKYLAANYYTQALRALNIDGDVEKSESKLLRATNFDDQDLYRRGLVDIGIIKMNQVVAKKDVSADAIREEFQNILGVTIQNAQQAINVNSLDPLNWMKLGSVYEAIAPLKIAGSEDLAIASYQEAINRSPYDPTPYLAMARVEIQMNNLQKAREYISTSLGVKSDFAAALFTLSQLESAEGNLDDAIQRAEETAFIVPNDVGVLFHLGLLYYQDKNYQKSQSVLERAISFNPDYSDARYFLGLSYSNLGMKKQAIEEFEKIEELNPGNAEVERILNNLRANRSALADISPPEESPEDREKLPIGE